MALIIGMEGVVPFVRLRYTWNYLTPDIQNMQNTIKIWKVSVRNALQISLWWYDEVQLYHMGYPGVVGQPESPRKATILLKKNHFVLCVQNRHNVDIMIGVAWTVALKCNLIMAAMSVLQTRAYFAAVCWRVCNIKQINLREHFTLASVMGAYHLNIMKLYNAYNANSCK